MEPQRNPGLRAPNGNHAAVYVKSYDPQAGRPLAHFATLMRAVEKNGINQERGRPPATAMARVAASSMAAARSLARQA